VPTFQNTLFHLHRLWTEQTDGFETWAYKFGLRGITKKEHNIHDTANV
jgi:hypothetical protein